MVSKVEPDRYANTGFSIADTPAELNEKLFEQIMSKTGEERLQIGSRMSTSARQLVWSSIPENIPHKDRQQLFLQRFYGVTQSSLCDLAS